MPEALKYSRQPPMLRAVPSESTNFILSHCVAASQYFSSSANLVVSDHENKKIKLQGIYD